MCMQASNRGKVPVHSLTACFAADHQLYRFVQPALALPQLQPGAQHGFNANFECLAPETGACGTVSVCLLQRGTSTCLAKANAAVPVSEGEA